MAQRRRSSGLIVAVLAPALALGAGIGVYGWKVLQDREAAVADLRAERQDLSARLATVTAERDTLVAELEAALRIGEDLSLRVDALQADLAEARSTRLEVREVRGTADFPIERAMARGGDTVAAFAEREGTTEAVVRALNPWLGETATLDGFQTLWVPKPD